MAKNIDIMKTELIQQIELRLADKIIERTNAELLIKLIKNAETIDEAVMIAELGTTYKRTGFHFDKRLEKMGDCIKFLKRNGDLSFLGGAQISPHKLIIGDNYDALQNLLITHRGRIDVIYIDPPYGKDKMGAFAETNYENAISRDNLLSMLYPRLVLARQLLSDEGTIFCSIDDRNQAYVRCLFDEVFDEKNFEGQIHWRRRHNQPNDKTKLIGLVAEHILVYSKNKEAHKDFGIGKIDITGTFSNPDNDPKGPWTTNPWKAARGRGGCKYDIVTPTGKVLSETWYGTKETFEKNLSENRVHWTNGGNGIPRIKIYQSEAEAQGQCATNWWNHTEYGSNQDATDELKAIFGGECPFDNPKPVKLIKSLIRLGSVKKDAVVLDFFAGSGTTGHAVLALNQEDGGNRTFILCTNNEKTPQNPAGIAYDVTTKRLKRISSGSCYDGGTAFSWLEENDPYDANLEVYDICSVFANLQSEGESPFDVIDEACYGCKPFESIHEKIAWVCNNFEATQKYIEGEPQYVTSC